MPLWTTALISTAWVTAGQTVVIDGHFQDWPEARADSGWTLLGHSDADALRILLHHPGPPRVYQQLDQPLTIGLDLDADETTGAGAGLIRGCDLAFILSPGEGSRGGVAARSFDESGTPESRSPYEFGFLGGPSTASRQHEFSIDRSTLPALPREIRVVFADGEGRTTTTEIDTRSRPDDTTRTRVQAIPTKAASDIRVISWNIERGGVLKRSGRVAEILSLLSPDVLLIQEVEDAQSSKAIKQLLESAMPGSPWTVALSPGGSGLRTAVATRLPAKPVAAFETVSRSDRPERRIRAAALLIQDGRAGATLAISIHLKCCGGLNGPEDLTRISEVLSIREAIAAAVEADRPDGLVIGGDFNLVASPVPLDVLRLNGQRLLGPTRPGDLHIAKAAHLDDGATFTWHDAKSPFVPGQLDFILSGGELVETKAFIFDTADLTAASLGGMPSDATAKASDHLPLVVDLMPTPGR